MEKLTHLDEGGQARMVDVSAKPATERRARARVTIAMQPATAAAIVAGDAPKGDVLGTARLAGIQAAKRTADLIPLAHPLPISQAAVEIAVDADAGRVTIIGPRGQRISRSATRTTEGPVVLSFGRMRLHTGERTLGIRVRDHLTIDQLRLR